MAAQVFQMHVCMWGALLESIQAFHLTGYQIIICHQPLAARGLLTAQILTVYLPLVTYSPCSHLGFVGLPCC